jgi:hypothetical protein
MTGSGNRHSPPSRFSMFATTTGCKVPSGLDEVKVLRRRASRYG